MMEHERGPLQGDLEASISYMIPMAEKPARHLCTPPAGAPELNWELESQTVPVLNIRARPDSFSLREQGFTLHTAKTAVTDFHDGERILKAYYPETERLVADITGARKVLAFDYNLRNSSKEARRRTGAFPPGRFAHADYTPKSAPKRVRELLPRGEAEERLAGRYVFINVWRPMNGPVIDEALAVCDARSVAGSDLVATDLIYEDRVGEIFNITFNPHHRWYYIRHMDVDEVLIFSNFDSHGSRVVPHSAFYDPTAAPDAPPRESVEVRTIAFF